MSHPFENARRPWDREPRRRWVAIGPEELAHEPVAERGTEHRSEVTYTPPPVLIPDSEPEPVLTDGRAEPDRGDDADPHTVSGIEADVDNGPAGVEEDPSEESGEETTHQGARLVAIDVSGVESAGNVLVAGGDATNIVHNHSGPAPLRSHEIDLKEIVTDKIFVPPGEPERARPGVFALIGPPNSGRRTVGLRLLGSLPEGTRLREFRRPDWDEPTTDRIPGKPDHGYLLDLTGMGEAIPEHFARDLIDYAKTAKKEGTLLVILGDEGVGRGLPSSDPEAGVVVREHQSPDALAIARAMIEAGDLHARAEWLEIEHGMFHGLLNSDAPPARGVELAKAVLQAEHENDESVLTAFADWRNQIQSWFEADLRREDAKGAEHRALRIAAAFLDGAPAPVVLNAADALLPQVVRDRFEAWGGALAAPDDQVRCRDAEVAFKDGRIFITDNREGLDTALIRYLWERRGSASVLLTDWLSEISAPGGHASACLDRLSTVLIEVAVAQGSATVLGLLERWLRQDPRRSPFVVQVLQELCAHPVLGPRVRVVDLRNWAKGSKNPERQWVVIEVCRGGFAQSYPEQALMRLRYVQQNTEDLELRRAAVSAIAEHLMPGRDRLSALKVLVDWVDDERTTLIGGRLFLELFGGPEQTNEAIRDDPARGLLALTGNEGEKVVELFGKAWSRMWNHPELRTDTSHALVSWREAADAENLPFDRTRRVLSATFQADGLDDDLDRIIRAKGKMGYLLFRDFYGRSKSGGSGESSGVPD